MAKDLKTHAKRLAAKIKELNLEVLKTKAKLSEAINNRQGVLVKTALSPNEKPSNSIERLNDQVGLLKQKLEDTSFVRSKLSEELNRTIQEVREERVKKSQEKVSALEAEKSKIISQMKELRTKAFKLEGKLRKAFVDGVLLPAPKDRYLVDRIMEAQGMVEEAKQATKEAILEELGIDLEAEAPKEPELIFPWRCGACGLEKSLGSEDERAQHAGAHECPAEERHQQRLKKEEVLS